MMKFLHALSWFIPMGYFRKIVMLSACVLLSFGGYLYFVASEAPNFFLWGDFRTDALLLFLVGGILFFVGLISGLINRAE